MQRKRTGTHALSIPKMKEQVVYISHDIYIRVAFSRRFGRTHLVVLVVVDDVVAEEEQV